MATALLTMTGALAAQSGDLVRNGALASRTPSEIVDPGKIYNDSQPTRWVGKLVTLQDVIVQDTTILATSG
jgi:hypothetical protein